MKILSMMDVNSARTALLINFLLFGICSPVLSMEKDENQQEQSNAVIFSTSSEEISSLHGFSKDQEIQQQKYVQNLNFLLVDMIKSLREEENKYTFNQPKSSFLTSVFSRFSVDAFNFLNEFRSFCTEEIEIINSMSLFNNYIGAKDHLIALYKPLKDEELNEYLKRINSEDIRKDKKAIEDYFNQGNKFTLLDTSKQEAYFRHFYESEKENNFEQTFSTFIEQPLAAAAKCYILAIQKNQLPSLFKIGFKGKCAVDKMERLEAWFSRGMKGFFAQSSKELDDTQELDVRINYSERLNVTVFKEPQAFVYTFINSLLLDSNNKNISDIKQQLDIIDQIGSGKHSSVRDPRFTRVRGFLVNRLISYIKSHEVKINKKRLFVEKKTKNKEKSKLILSMQDLKNIVDDYFAITYAWEKY